MKVLAIICFLIWVYIISVLKRSKLDFWFFLIGSVGSFIFLLIWVQPVLTTPLTKGVAAVSGVLGDMTNFYESYFQYSLLFIENVNSNISLYIDYECSGIIEIMAYSSMLWFFPIYTAYEKAIANILGLFWIFLANVIRIFVICTLIHFFGDDIYFFAHTIFGRIVFYGLSIALYYYIFTRPQIERQKVGKFKYGVH